MPINFSSKYGTLTSLYATTFFTDATNYNAFGNGNLTLSGTWNTANGFAALFNNVSGNNNTANGYQALSSNNNGNSNTAIGVRALFNNVSGNNNTAIGGYGALVNTLGSNNIGIGYNADVSGNFSCCTQIDTGNNITPNTMQYQNNRIADISGLAITAGSNITVTKANTGITISSTAVSGSTSAGIIAYNHLDNPDFQVSQFYGETPATLTVANGTNVDWLDRWRVNNTGSGSLSANRISMSNDQISSSYSDYYIKFSGPNAATAVGLQSRLVASQVKKMDDVGTVSFWIKPIHASAGTSISAVVNFSTPTSADIFTTVNNRNSSGNLTITVGSSPVWQKITYSYTGLKSWTNISNGLIFESTFKVASGDANWKIQIADVMINNGASAANFYNPTRTESELRCLPFFRKTFARDQAVGNKKEITAGSLYCKSPTVNASTLSTTWQFSPPMRISSPTITIYTYDSDTGGLWSSGGAWITASVYIVSESSTFIAASTGTTSVGTGYLLHATCDARP